MMKFKILTLILLVSMAGITAHAEDYQYQYFANPKEKDKYVPFSDYIPKNRLHWQTVPHYLEDFYLLYGMKQHYNNDSLYRNISFLKTALTKNFRHPSQALVKVETEKEYLKYRRVMFMHINLLIMRNYLKLAHRYDKRRIYFHNAPWKKEILDSFTTAEKLYNEAKPYWEKAKQYAGDATKIKITTDLGTMESERYRIVTGDLDYGKIIDTYLKRLNNKRNTLAGM